MMCLLWIAALAGGCDSDSDFQMTQSGLLSISPESLIFPVVAPGQQAQQELTLRNVGSATITVVNPRFNRDDAPYQVSLPNGDPVPSEVDVDPGAETPTVFLVTYTPSEAQTVQADDAFIFGTNSAQQRQVNVPISTSDATPDLVVTPASFDFGSVDAGEVAEIEATLSNVGQGPLLISEIRIDGSGDFSAILDDQTLNEEDRGAMTIEPGARRTMIIRYEPPTAGPDLADLVIISNHPQAAELRTPIIANGAAPCIQITPDTLDFGASLLVADREGETPNLLPMIIESCGGTPLKISAIEFEGAAFGFPEALEPNEEGDLILLPAAAASATFPSYSIDVGFWPTAEQNYGGRMLLYTNTSADPLVVDLFGRGVENSCPLPVTTIERYEVAPLEIITLDGSPSADSGGEVQRWVWSVIERPSGSVSQVVESLFSNADPAGGGPEDDEATPTATFFVDLAGRYVIELEVYDNLGQVSCAPNAVATVVIEAIPEKDLHIQLVWSTPEDPDETDEFGTDVDLHFKHQNGDDRWGAAAGNWDCYFQNTSPDWGSVGDFLDNPSLDIDDINGAGPENVNLNQPEVGTSYDVAALYFRAESVFGETGRDPRIEHDSYVTVRIFARGELIGEFVDRAMNRLNQLWHVATVNWCEDPLACPVVTQVDRLYEEGEYAQ
jgi:hypothetical protein